MYFLNRDDNELIKLENTSFSEQNIRERDHIQEWIRKDSSILGDPLLIIACEYIFENRERLDLLGIDTDGNVVVIENKQDITGALVDFQALRYVSYCSTLAASDIIEIYADYLSINEEEAESQLLDFLELDSPDKLNNVLNQEQRMIIVSNEFDKRVLSVAAWLHQNGINIKCISIKPYIREQQVFIDVNQIIPPVDIDQYYVRRREHHSRASNTTQQEEDIISFFEVIIDVIKQNGFRCSYSRKDTYCKGKIGISAINIILGYSKKTRVIDVTIETYNNQVQPLHKFFQDYSNELEARTNLNWSISDGRNPNWTRIKAKMTRESDIAELSADTIAKEYLNIMSIAKELLSK